MKDLRNKKDVGTDSMFNPYVATPLRMKIVSPLIILVGIHFIYLYLADLDTWFFNPGIFTKIASFILAWSILPIGIWIAYGAWHK